MQRQLRHAETSARILHLPHRHLHALGRLSIRLPILDLLGQVASVASLAIFRGSGLRYKSLLMKLGRPTRFWEALESGRIDPQTLSMLRPHWRAAPDPGESGGWSSPHVELRFRPPVAPPIRRASSRISCRADFTGLQLFISGDDQAERRWLRSAGANPGGRDKRILRPNLAADRERIADNARRRSVELINFGDNSASSGSKGARFITITHTSLSSQA